MTILWKLPPIPGFFEIEEDISHGGRVFELVSKLSARGTTPEIYFSHLFKDVVWLEVTHMYALSPEQIDTGTGDLVDLGGSPELAELNASIRESFNVKQPYFKYRYNYPEGPCFDFIAQDWAMRSSDPRVAQYQRDPNAKWLSDIEPWKPKPPRPLVPE